VAASNSATANFVLATGTVALSTANASVNSLKLVGSAGGTNVTLNGTMTVTSRGILFDNTSGSASISGGTQLGVTGTEIIAHTYGGGDITTNKLTLNGVIKGSATVLTKAGPGTLVLSGVNTYTGSLIINEGVVEYANGSAGSQNLGAPTAAATNILLNGGILRQTATNNLIYGITVNSYAKLDVPTSVTLTQTAQGITGKAGVAGILQKTGDGTLTFSGTTDNPSLSLEVVGGVVNLGKTSTATAHSVGVAAGSTAAGTMGAALIIGNGTTVNITGTGNDQIHDQSSVVVKSTGVFNLGGGAATAESFDSLAGTGSVTNTGLTGTFILTLGAGNNVNVSAYSVAAADAGMSATGLNNFGGVLSDGGVGKVLALTKIGSGTQILSGLSTYSGATNINAGTLQLGITNALPSGAGKGDVNIVGNGYGAGTINGGTSIGTADKILAPGTLDLGGFDQAINGLNSTTGGYVVNNPTLSWNGSAWVAAASTKVLSLGHGDASGSFNGVIMNGYTVAPGVVTAQAYVGTLALTKTGTGTQTLAGFNTYTGATIVEQGTLLVSGSLGGTTSVDVLNGATLGGTGSINTAATVTVESDGTLSPGASIGTLSSGSVSLLSGSIFKLEINTTATTTDRSAITGNLSLALTNDAVLSISDLAPAPIGSGTFAFITYTGSWNGGLFKFEGNTIADDGFLMVSGNSYLLDYNFGGNSVALLAVPEPGAITSLLGGLGLLVGLQRFRRRGAPARA
jgi:autotransporter-associated beta strand protein